ncbi:protein starmaker-like [Vigna umbellata]|uniref:protein starmaker-like n=1 Tax=Vigna umbellata TaxID=87088 RepID=UPI001F5F3017|nr:protein starmaker-like [Vigna umbellata]XP_047154298.1 protein starmaker-like [Vigna umbellata]
MPGKPNLNPPTLSCVPVSGTEDELDSKNHKEGSGNHEKEGSMNHEEEGSRKHVGKDSKTREEGSKSHVEEDSKDHEEEGSKKEVEESSENYEEEGPKNQVEEGSNNNEEENPKTREEDSKNHEEKDSKNLVEKDFKNHKEEDSKDHEENNSKNPEKKYSKKQKKSSSKKLEKKDIKKKLNIPLVETLIQTRVRKLTESLRQEELDRQAWVSSQMAEWLEAEAEMDIRYLKKSFPDISQQSLTDVYLVNGGDLGDTLDMLSLLESDDLGPSEIPDIDDPSKPVPADDDSTSPKEKQPEK